MVIMVAPLEDAQHLTPQDDHLHQEAEAQFCSLKFMSFAFWFLNHPTGIAALSTASHSSLHFES
jgi:hypothetical protein